MTSNEHSQVLHNCFNRTFNYDDKVFYAHELGSELLVNHLTRTSEPNKLKLSMNHLDEIVKEAFPFTSSSIKLDNGWTIRSRITGHGLNTNSLYLPTVLSTNRILEIHAAIKSNSYHPLIAELSLASMIYKNRNNQFNLKLFIVAIDRLHTDYKRMPTEAWNIIELTNPISDNDLTKLYTERTNQLEQALSDNSEPSRCTNIKWHKSMGKSRNMTCLRCNYSDACSHFSDYAKSKQIQNNIIF